MKLKGKTVLVTGASKGIGRGIAVAAAEEGANVIVNYYSDKQGAEKTLSMVQKRGQDGIIVYADVSSGPEVNEMFKNSTRTFDIIDVLVNCAGIALWKPFLQLDEETWDKTINVNLKGVFLCSKVFAERLVKQNKKGSIVNISSNAAAGALDCLAAYCASKGGVTLLTKSMANELAPHCIRVNAVAPGAIDVERNRKLDKNFPDNWIPFIPLRHIGKVNQIAKPVVFLASDDSDYITGQTLWVDGGATTYIPMPPSDFAR